MPTMPTRAWPITLAAALALSPLCVAAAASAPVKPQPASTAYGMAGVQAKSTAPCQINFIGHETGAEMTRVILHATAPIDYRGGQLRGDQVILDLANIEVTLPTPVVEIGAPEVDRVVIGPEIKREDGTVLKVRLTGVKARSHKVQAKGNELYVDLTPLKGARGEKGMPKLINNSSEVHALDTTPGSAPAVAWANIPPTMSVVATPAGKPTVTRIETASSGAKVWAQQPEPGQATPAPAKKDEAPSTDLTGAAKISATPTAALPISHAALLQPVSAPAPPLTTTMAMAAGETAGTARSLRIAVGRSLTLETGLPISRVSVSNPAVAEPIAISPTQLLINGLAPGTVSLVLWPKEGAAIVYELVIHIDSAALEQQMKAIFPEEHVRVQSSKDSIVLTGPVSSSDMADKLMRLATDYSPKVVNHMAGPGAARKQVMLKVKFAEVSKQAITEFASVLHHVDPTNPAGSDRGTSGTGAFNPPRGNLLNQPGGPELTWGDAINLSFFEKSLDLGLFITALKQRGLFQELAEPTLIAADGQEANFLAGGEFPVPIAQPGANFVAITVVWKKFGISLDFKPSIHNDGVIVMKVKPEVSSLDFTNGVLIEGFRIPALTVRRAETEVELKDGQSFAIAGLYDRNLMNTKSKIPVLGDIPLLGHLFRSKSLEKNRTELLVIVTPQIVEPLGSGTELPSLEMPETLDDTEKPVKK